MAALDVTEAGVAVGGDDAEGDEGIGLLADDVEGGADGFLESGDRLDDVVGGDDGHHGVFVFGEEDTGGEADGVGGVAADGLAEEIVLGQLGEIFEHAIAMGGGGADVDALGREEAAEALVGEL